MLQEIKNNDFIQQFLLPCQSLTCVHESKGWFIRLRRLWRRLCVSFHLYFCVSFHLYFCVVVCIDVQYTCGPLVYGHVACVTHSSTAKAEVEAARWRSIIAVTAANKYQIIKSLFKTTKRRPQRNRRRWQSFNLHKDLYHGRSTLFVADN